ncbi:MAG: hydrogenase, partial [Gemmatimonadaceae bacterium]
FAVLGTSRITACIRALAVQGVLLGALSVVIESPFSLHAVILGAGTVVVKSVVLPWFLRWAMREAAVRREVEPAIGYLGSLLLGAVAVGLSFAVASRLPDVGVDAGQASLLVPVAFATLLTGLLVLTTRSKAITQVVGYLMLENGVYLFGLTLVQRISFLVEIGVLLDVFVAVFIMGIVVFHINREFDSISAANLVELKES